MIHAMVGPHWERLIKALQCLPHVGPKSAQRMAHQLLTREREGAKALAEALNTALAHLHHCALCQTLCEDELCSICADERRARHTLCVVSSPMDLMVIEQTRRWDGLYFVLLNTVSPLNSVNLSSAGFLRLRDRLSQEPDHPIREMVLALNFNTEGETTAHLIAEMLHGEGIKISRLAHGVPHGGEIEYLDLGTVAQALVSRQAY